MLFLDVFTGFFGLLYGILTLWLLRAWRQSDFALLETVIGNGHDPFAAFALDFEVVSPQFCDELTAFTSGFGRLELFAQPPGVSVKIHRKKKDCDKNSTAQ